MQIIDISEFEVQCDALLEQVIASGEIICITRESQPIAELRPTAEARLKSPFGLGKDAVAITGGVLTPVEVEGEASKESVSVAEPSHDKSHPIS